MGNGGVQMKLIVATKKGVYDHDDVVPVAK